MATALIRSLALLLLSCLLLWAGGLRAAEISLGQALLRLYPAADATRDYQVVDRGDGPQIAKWDEAKLGPRPSQEQLEATEAGKDKETVSVLLPAATMGHLRAMPGRPGVAIALLGYCAPGDGAEGTFVWRAGETRADNGGTIIEPTGHAGAAGRWLRICDPRWLNVKWFGARGDGTSDDTLAIQATSDALPPFLHYAADPVAYTDHSGRPLRTGTVYLPAGTYMVSDTIHMSHCCKLQGAGLWSYGGTTIRLMPAVFTDPKTERWVVKFETFEKVSPNNLFSTVVEGISIVDDMGGNEGSSGLYCVGAQGTIFDNVHIWGMALRGAVLSGHARYLIVSDTRRGPGLKPIFGLTSDYLEVSHTNKAAAIEPGWGMPWPGIDIIDCPLVSAQVVACEANGNDQILIRMVTSRAQIGTVFFNSYGYTAVTGLRVAGVMSGLNIGQISSLTPGAPATLIHDDSQGHNFSGGESGKGYSH